MNCRYDFMSNVLFFSFKRMLYYLNNNGNSNMFPFVNVSSYVWLIIFRISRHYSWQRIIFFLSIQFPFFVNYGMVIIIRIVLIMYEFVKDFHIIITSHFILLCAFIWWDAKNYVFSYKHSRNLIKFYYFVF